MRQHQRVQTKHCNLRRRQRRKQSPLPNHKFLPKTGAVRRHVLRKRPLKSCLLKVCQKNNRAAAELYQKGNQLIASGSIKEDLSAAKQAQRADRSFAEVYRALATAYKMNGDSKNASKAIKQFLQKKTLGSKRQSAYQKRYCDS